MYRTENTHPSGEATAHDGATPPQNFRELIKQSIKNPDNLVGYGGNKAVFRIEGQKGLLLGVSYNDPLNQGSKLFNHLLDNHKTRELAPRNAVTPTEAFYQALRNSTYLTPPQHLYVAHGMGQEIAQFTNEHFRQTGLMLIREEPGETLLSIENKMVAEELGILPEDALEQYRQIKETETSIDRAARGIEGKKQNGVIQQAIDLWAEVRCKKEEERELHKREPSQETTATVEALREKITSLEVQAKAIDKQARVAVNNAARSAVIAHYQNEHVQNPENPQAAARAKAHSYIVENILLPNLKTAYKEIMTYVWNSSPDAVDLKPDNILWDTETNKLTFIDQGRPEPRVEHHRRVASVQNCLDAMERMLDDYSYDISPELRNRLDTERAELRAHYETEITKSWPSMITPGKSMGSNNEYERSLDLNAFEHAKSPLSGILSEVRQWLGCIDQGITAYAAKAT